MKAGIGYANIADGMSSGRKVAENAVKDGNIVNPGIVIAFASGNIDHYQFFNGIRSVVGHDVPVIGGSAIGVITGTEISYEGYPSAAAVIESDTLKLELGVAGDLDKDEKTAGETLGSRFTDTGKLLLILYDSVKKGPSESGPPVINASRPLIRGIEKKLNQEIPILGGGVIGDYGFGTTWQFCGSYVANQSVAGLMLGGKFTPYYRIMHGCIPKDGIYHRVTKAEGPVIYELDGRPVVKIIDEQYGSSEWRKQTPVHRLTLAINHSEKYADFTETDFVNRLISGALPDEKGIVLFEPDIEEGDEVLFMLRNGAMMIGSAKKNTLELFEEIASRGEKPMFGLYIDCAGRTAVYSETLSEEASEVQKVFNQHNVPLLGFYSGVEIAPVQGKSRGLDWTGVLLVLAQK
ncbi:MAG: hypothetical protein GX654_04315 [Desulfatiglans sp.]|nr:hypothetical protein [Desulfatiglans sp.]